MFCSYAFGNWVTKAIPIFVPTNKNNLKHKLNCFWVVFTGEVNLMISLNKLKSSQFSQHENCLQIIVGLKPRPTGEAHHDIFVGLHLRLQSNS
jgi:hypothetical protein